MPNSTPESDSNHQEHALNGADSTVEPVEQDSDVTRLVEESHDSAQLVTVAAGQAIEDVVPETRQHALLRGKLRGYAKILGVHVWREPDGWLRAGDRSENGENVRLPTDEMEAMEMLEELGEKALHAFAKERGFALERKTGKWVVTDAPDQRFIDREIEAASPIVRVFLDQWLSAIDKKTQDPDSSNEETILEEPLSEDTIPPSDDGFPSFFFAKNPAVQWTKNFCSHWLMRAAAWHKGVQLIQEDGELKIDHPFVLNPIELSWDNINLVVNQLAIHAQQMEEWGNLGVVSNSKPDVLSFAEEEIGRANREFHASRTFVAARDTSLSDESIASMHGGVSDMEIVSQLGSGGMGSVYNVSHDGRSDATMALKVATPERPSTKDELYAQHKALQRIQTAHRRLMQEVQALKESGIPVYWVSKLAFLTDCFSGANLLSLTSSLSLSDNEKLRITHWLLRKIQSNHAHDIVHADIKPAQILLPEGRDPVLVDYGLVEPMRQNSALDIPKKTVIGTPAYMSPEVARGEYEDAIAADMYTLGTTLYEVWTGTTLTRKDTTNRMLLDKQQLNEDVIRERCKEDGFPEVFVEALLHLVTYYPKNRSIEHAQEHWEEALGSLHIERPYEHGEYAASGSLQEIAHVYTPEQKTEIAYKALAQAQIAIENRGMCGDINVVAFDHIMAKVGLGGLTQAKPHTVCDRHAAFSAPETWDDSDRSHDVRTAQETTFSLGVHLFEFMQDIEEPAPFTRVKGENGGMRRVYPDPFAGRRCIDYASQITGLPVDTEEDIAAMWLECRSRPDILEEIFDRAEIRKEHRTVLRLLLSMNPQERELSSAQERAREYVCPHITCLPEDYVTQCLNEDKLPLSVIMSSPFSSQGAQENRQAFSALQRILTFAMTITNTASFSPITLLAQLREIERAATNDMLEEGEYTQLQELCQRVYWVGPHDFSMRDDEDELSRRRIFDAWGETPEATKPPIVGLDENSSTILD